MANGGTVTPVLSPAGEFDTITNQVYISGAATPYLYCSQVEKNTGIMPDKAKLRFNHELVNQTGVDYECYGPNTLNALSGTNILPIFGERIGIDTVNGLVFVGSILDRNDNGAGDAILLDAVSDIELLSKIPIRGAVVKDETQTSGEYKINFLSRYKAEVNPNGLWNCIGHTVNITGHPLDGQVVPVFAARSRRRQNYDSPDSTFNTNLQDNVITPWTPRRALQYIYFVLHLGFNFNDDVRAPDIPGLGPDTWRHIKDSNYFDWKYDTISAMDGTEPSDGTGAVSSIDPLDRKLPTQSFQGSPALSAINKILTAAGTHELKTSPVRGEPIPVEDGPDIITFKTAINFFPIGLTGATIGETISSNIPVMVSGNASWLPNSLTGVDFQLAESIMDRRSSVLIEGDVVKSEARLVGDEGIKRGWTLEQELAFQQIIWGSESALDSTAEHAKYPLTQTIDGSDIPAFSTWVEADGQGGRQDARARSAQAVQLARSLFPRVYKAFRIDSEHSSVTEALKGFIDSDGAGGRKYEDQSVYPIGKVNRPVLENQLQFQILDANQGEGGGTGNNWIEERLPVRVEIQNNGDWVEAEYVTLQNLGDGVFLMDMAEQYDNKPQCIYDGQLYNSMPGLPNTLEVTLKDFRLNIAIPTDHRLEGYSEAYPLNEDGSLVNTFYDRAVGGASLQYVDSPGSYREEMQVASTPSPYQTYQDDSGTVTAPLNRFVPPGTEQSNIDLAAARRLYQTQKIRRTGSWTLMGIRQDYYTGLWIKNVRQIAVDINGNITDAYAPYNMNAPVMSLVYDFDAQKTMINGLIGE